MYNSNTLDTAFVPVATTDTGRPSQIKPSLLKRIAGRIMANQERRARAIVRAHLVQHSDEALVGLGWTAAEIAELRQSPAAQSHRSL